MRSRLQLGVILALILVTLVCAGVRIQAWNPATHIYIAKNVYPAYAGSPAFWYGAIAPDMAMYVPDGYNWASAFWDTHWTVTDLRIWATNRYERSFARGWITHNEAYAADHFAHGYPPLYLAGYVTLRARLLATLSPVAIPDDVAHYAVETAVDILMQARHPELAGELLAAVPQQPTVAQGLLKRAFVWWPFQRTTVQALYLSEAQFDAVAGLYAQALVAWSSDHRLMQGLGVEIARQSGVTVTAAEVELLLQAAMAMCDRDLDLAMAVTVRAVAASVPR